MHVTDPQELALRIERIALGLLQVNGPSDEDIEQRIQNCVGLATFFIHSVDNEVNALIKTQPPD